MYSILPKIEAYKELQLRQIKTPMTASKAYDLILRITEDVDKAEAEANAVEFATIPLE